MSVLDRNPYGGQWDTGAIPFKTVNMNDEKKSFSYVMCNGIEKSIGIGMGAPFAYFDYFYGFHTFINTYNYYEETQKALIAAMYGEIPFKGGEPFKLVPDEFTYLK